MQRVRELHAQPRRQAVRELLVAARGARQPWFTITPISVTPSVAPIERANCVSAVAEPIARRGTEFCTDRTKICIIIPSPIPAITMLRAASPFVVFTSICQSRTIPAPRRTGPMSVFGR